MTISSWLNFGRPVPPGRGSAAGRKFLAPHYYSQRAVFASPWALFSFIHWGKKTRKASERFDSILVWLISIWLPSWPRPTMSASRHIPAAELTRASAAHHVTISTNHIARYSLSPPRRLCFCVYVLVCLSAGKLKSCRRILMIFVDGWDVCADTDYDADIRIFYGIFTMRDRAILRILLITPQVFNEFLR